MFDKAEIVDGRYYRDWKYPRKPISVEFIKNPAKYCKAHPFEYPCEILANTSSSLRN
jgi:hypothetical protein